VPTTAGQDIKAADATPRPSTGGSQQPPPTVAPPPNDVQPLVPQRNPLPVISSALAEAIARMPRLILSDGADAGPAYGNQPELVDMLRAGGQLIATLSTADGGFASFRRVGDEFITTPDPGCGLRFRSMEEVQAALAFPPPPAPPQQHPASGGSSSAAPTNSSPDAASCNYQ
jgi:hypothetical protein